MPFSLPAREWLATPADRDGHAAVTLIWGSLQRTAEAPGQLVGVAKATTSRILSCALNDVMALLECRVTGRPTQFGHSKLSKTTRAPS